MSSRVINLTLPFYPGMPVGSVWAHDPPLLRNDITTAERNGMQVEYMSLGSETGSRLMMAAAYENGKNRIKDIDFSDLVDRATAVIHIPKKAREFITPSDIEEKIGGCSYWEKGMALLIHTGWGDNERYLSVKDEYALGTPCFSPEAGSRLAKIMRERESNLFGVDVAYIGGRGESHLQPQWCSKPAWQRPPWPSDRARVFLRAVTSEQFNSDFPASPSLHGVGFVLAALRDIGKIRSTVVRMTALPMFVAHAAGAPVTVVAVED